MFSRINKTASFLSGATDTEWKASNEKQPGEKEQKDHSDYLFEQEVKIGAVTYSG